jgi:hypothetical protein
MFYLFKSQLNSLFLVESKNEEEAINIINIKKSIDMMINSLFNRNDIKIGIKCIQIYSDKKQILNKIETFKKLYEELYLSECGDFYIYLNNFPLFLQHSNQKEISPIIHHFINHPLFDKNVLGVINDYFKD